eukprot:9468444-Pyramimonas_sp.AAC.1
MRGARWIASFRGVALCSSCAARADPVVQGCSLRPSTSLQRCLERLAGHCRWKKNRLFISITIDVQCSNAEVLHHS